MIVRPPIPLALDNIWRDSFSPADKALALPSDITGLTASMSIAPVLPHWIPSSWWYGQDGAQISTDTGEIVNSAGKLTVAYPLAPGKYRIRGDYTKSGVTAPFIAGTLVIDNGIAQLSVLPLGTI